ncbi:MAG: GtrA family protein [uncultured bacterium]|nr:MAG: GtrA family protein [uncultured bacterium]
MIYDFCQRNSQFLFFALIGVANTMIHGAVLIFAVEQLSIDVVISNLLAFCIANLSSYLMNSRLTFKKAMSFLRYLRFFLASILSLGLTLFISWVAEFYGAHYLVGFLAIVIFVPALSFLVMKFWAFSDDLER